MEPCKKTTLLTLGDIALLIFDILSQNISIQLNIPILEKFHGCTTIAIYHVSSKTKIMSSTQYTCAIHGISSVNNNKLLKCSTTSWLRNQQFNFFGLSRDLPWSPHFQLVFHCVCVPFCSFSIAFAFHHYFNTTYYYKAFLRLLLQLTIKWKGAICNQRFHLVSVCVQCAFVLRLDCVHCSF